MKHKMLLLSLAILLTAVATHAEPVCGDADTLWVKSMWPKNFKGVRFHPSGETIVVSIDETDFINVGTYLNVLDAENGDSLRAFLTQPANSSSLFKL